MIGKIKGTLTELEGNKGLISTSSGLFYELLLTPHLISLYIIGSPIEVYTYLQVREDAHILFGFSTKNEKKLFELLISISGVGPKTAFGIISFSTEDELFTAVRSNDVGYFSKVPGLGKKTAMKILLELSTRLKSEFEMEKMYLTEEDKTVVDAFVSLGFKSQEAKKLLSRIPKNLSLEEKIKEGLKLATEKR